MTESSRFQPADDGYEARVRDSFGRQAAMETIGVAIERVEPGEVELSMPFNPAFCQQHGFLHAGTVTTVIDSACGYAAYSLMASDAAVLSVEFKINLLSPAKGERFFFIGRVVKPGRTISNVRGEAFAESNGQRKLIATMDGTMITIRDRDGLSG
jgi:uncharacterized protein (TIGR00369 family)